MQREANARVSTVNLYELYPQGERDGLSINVGELDGLEGFTVNDTDAESPHPLHRDVALIARSLYVFNLLMVHSVGHALKVLKARVD